ncbi:hypothetical protein ACJW31_03G034100 [Castanea mollissima]
MGLNSRRRRGSSSIRGNQACQSGSVQRSSRNPFAIILRRVISTTLINSSSNMGLNSRRRRGSSSIRGNQTCQSGSVQRSSRNPFAIILRRVISTTLINSSSNMGLNSRRRRGCSSIRGNQTCQSGIVQHSSRNPFDQRIHPPSRLFRVLLHILRRSWKIDLPCWFLDSTHALKLVRKY